jgi:glyoxylase-like metal-dependent hydrolase (beta-lactamase superfamily II)
MRHLHLALWGLLLPAAWLPAAPSGAAEPTAPRLIAEGGPPLFGSGSLKLWDLEKITDEVYTFRHTFYRTFFVITKDGVIAADPLNPKAAPVLREQIRSVTDKPVKYLAYSHSHWDHVGGGRIFKDEGAVIVAQEQCAANFREVPNPDITMPDVTFRDHHRIELGGKSLDMHYFGPSHDNCLVVMHIRPENLLFVVDMANPPSGWIMLYNPAASEDRVWNMVPFLGRVADLIEREQIRTIMGGHMTTGLDPGTGRPTVIRGTIGPSSTISERRDLWRSVIDATRAELAAGTPALEIPDKLVAEKFLADRIIGYDPEKMRIFARRIVSYAQTGE